MVRIYTYDALTPIVGELAATPAWADASRTRFSIRPLADTGIRSFTADSLFAVEVWARRRGGAGPALLYGLAGALVGAAVGAAPAIGCEYLGCLILLATIPGGTVVGSVVGVAQARGREDRWELVALPPRPASR